MLSLWALKLLRYRNKDVNDTGGAAAAEVIRIILLILPALNRFKHGERRYIAMRDF